MGKGVEIMGFDVIDGELYDEETGEYAGPASGWITGNESPEDLALLVMRKRIDIEAAFDAETAKEMGLVSRVVDDEALLDEAMAIAERIVCNPPRALRLTKRLLREAQHSRMSDILELSAAYQAIIHETSDNREAINAFVEKRPPVFTGD
jgi:hypothetical protein